MKMPRAILPVVICAALVLAALMPGCIHSTGSPASAGGNPPNGTPRLPDANSTAVEDHTALFSKDITAGTPYIIVSLYSGDLDDPISVTVITPDSTLGPFHDSSDGKADGRIDMKISDPETLKPGTWKFVIHSRKPIATGSLENLSWIRTG